MERKIQMTDVEHKIQMANIDKQIKEAECASARVDRLERELDVQAGSIINFALSRVSDEEIGQWIRDSREGGAVTGKYGCVAGAESHVSEISGVRVWFVHVSQLHIGHGETEQDAMESAVRQLRAIARLVEEGVVNVRLRERDGVAIREEYFNFPPERESEVEECSGRRGFRDAARRMARLILGNGWRRP